MTVTIKIDTGNAAFDDEPAHEVSRILRELAKRMATYSLEPGDVERLADVNGNIVGAMLVER